MQVRYERLVTQILDLAPKIARALPPEDAHAFRGLASECRRAVGEQRVVLAMTLSDYAIHSLSVDAAVLHEQLAVLDAGWVAATTTRKRAA